MEDIMTCPVILIEEEDWIVAKEITTDIASQGKTINEALANLKEALELFYEDTPISKPRSFFTTTLEVCV